MSDDCTLPAHSRTLPQQFAAVSRRARQLASEEARGSAPFGDAASLHSDGGGPEPTALNWEEGGLRRQSRYLNREAGGSSAAANWRPQPQQR